MNCNKRHKAAARREEYSKLGGSGPVLDNKQVLLMQQGRSHCRSCTTPRQGPFNPQSTPKPQIVKPCRTPAPHLLEELPWILCCAAKGPVTVVLPVALPLLLLPLARLRCFIRMHKLGVPVHLTVVCQ